MKRIATIAVVAWLLVAGQARAAVTSDFLQGGVDTADLTTYTFSAANLGTADAARYIVVCFHQRAAGTPTLSSASIGGVSATIVAQATLDTGGGASNTTAIVIAAVPTGTTGDIVATWSAGAVRCAYQAYRLVGISSATASDTDTSVAAGDPTVNLDIPAGGWTVGGAISGTGSVAGPVTWTGITEDDDTNLETSCTVTSANGDFATTQTGLALTADYTSPSFSVGVFASWDDEGAPPASTGGFFLLLGSLRRNLAPFFAFVGQ